MFSALVSLPLLKQLKILIVPKNYADVSPGEVTMMSNFWGMQEVPD